uniref:Uncharacterized protein n=1 Tax=Klebsiella pneumoniae TaxID=573 RepID=A0A8B0SRS7_KLEPN|nr:hypothetical protein [Klebsiella pneumoniae]
MTSGREELTRRVGRYKKTRNLCRVPSRYAPVSLLPVTALAPKKKTEDDWISAILRRAESLRYSRSYRVFLTSW